MQLDTRIPLMVQGPQIESPQNMLAQALQVRALQGRVQDQERQMQQRNQLAGVLGTAFDDQGRLQAGALGRIGQVAPDFVPQYAQLASTQQRLDRQDKMTDTSVAMKKQQWAQQGFAVSNTPQEAANYIQNGVQSGILTPEEGQRGLSQIPQDPAAYKQWRDQINQSMMTAAQRAELESNGGYGAAVFTDQGIAQFDKKGNYKLATGPDGKPLRPASFDPTTQGAVAGAKTTASEQAKKDVAKPGQAIEAKAALDSTVSSLDRLRERALAIRDNPALGSVTGVSGMFPNFPGGDAADVQGDLDNLRSQVGFSVLQAMRDASKTGGALGAISDKENELLQNNLAPLMKKQSKEKTQQSLQEIIDYVDAAKGRLNSTYQQQYGNVSPQAQQPGAGPAGVLSQNAGRSVLRTGKIDGRRIVQYSDGTVEYAD